MPACPYICFLLQAAMYYSMPSSKLPFCWACLLHNQELWIIHTYTHHSSNNLVFCSSRYLKGFWACFQLFALQFRHLNAKKIQQRHWKEEESALNRYTPFFQYINYASNFCSYMCCMLLNPFLLYVRTNVAMMIQILLNLLEGKVCSFLFLSLTVS